MFVSQPTYVEKPKYMSAGRLFHSERKYQSDKTHVASTQVGHALVVGNAAGSSTGPTLGHSMTGRHTIGLATERLHYTLGERRARAPTTTRSGRISKAPVA